MKKVKLFLIAITLITSYSLTAQISVTTDGSSADASAMLDVKSTDKGMLIPRLTQSEIEAITNPANGLIVFNSDDNLFYFYDDVAGEWKEIAIGTGTISPIVPFTCGDALIDARDSQSYTTIQIGTQCWMAENLNIGTMVNGTSNQTNNSIIEKYCFNNSISNCDTYGGLYQWDEMMEYSTTPGTQGICPTGWHSPTDDEWKTIEMYLGMTSTEANNTGWRGTNEASKLAGNATLWANGILENNADFGTSGFDCLPGGFRLTDGTFSSYWNYSGLWSSNEDGSNAWRRILLSNYTQVSRYSNDKAYGMRVRCLQD